jgi:hypothetical protein
MVRSHSLSFGLFYRQELPPGGAAKRRNRPQTLAGSDEVFGYFFFFLAVFFAFFAFFAFLAMLPSVIPKVGSMLVDHRHACIQNTPQLQI